MDKVAYGLTSVVDAVVGLHSYTTLDAIGPPRFSTRRFAAA